MGNRPAVAAVPEPSSCPKAEKQYLCKTSDAGMMCERLSNSEELRQLLLKDAADKAAAAQGTVAANNKKVATVTTTTRVKTNGPAAANDLVA